MPSQPLNKVLSLVDFQIIQQNNYHYKSNKISVVALNKVVDIHVGHAIFNVCMKTVFIYNKNDKKSIFNKNERRGGGVKTQKACEQGWDANKGVERTQNKPLPYNPT